MNNIFIALRDALRIIILSVVGHMFMALKDVLRIIILSVVRRVVGIGILVLGATISMVILYHFPSTLGIINAIFDFEATKPNPETKKYMNIAGIFIAGATMRVTFPIARAALNRIDLVTCNLMDKAFGKATPPEPPDRRT